jgi:hypothetical protein
VELTAQAILWSILYFSVINKFHLEELWYLVISCVVIIELILTLLHQKVTFPSLISYFGYEPNEKLKDSTKFRISDHIVKMLTMFVMVYLCIQT